MRIITLLVRHGTSEYVNAVQDCDALFARQLPDAERDLLIIDNSQPSDYQEHLGRNRILIGASNEHWEFSAWDCGLSYLGQRIYDYHFVNLVTSAFRTLYTRYLDRFDTDMLELIRGRGAAVGHIDYYNEPVTLLGRSLQAWVRSSFMFLPPEELALLGSLVSVTNRESFFSERPDAPFRPDAALSSNYRNYILDWLTGAGTGQGVEWHSRFCLTPENLDFFKAKALAILNEQMLGVRLRAQGCTLVDATWLATRRRSLRAGQSLGAIPSWRLQVTTRDMDAAPNTLMC